MTGDMRSIIWSDDVEVSECRAFIRSFIVVLYHDVSQHARHVDVDRRRSH